MSKQSDKLKALIDEIDVLINDRVTSSKPEFKAWKMKVERYLAKTFGENSIELSEFRSTLFSLSVYVMGTGEDRFIEKCKSGLLNTKAVFMTYLEEMEEEEQELQNESIAIEVNGGIDGNKTKLDKVFIVHGHDGAMKEAVARIIENQGIKAIILNEQVNQGLTIIEKFEKYSDVGAAVCLFTADDVGGAKASDVAMSRARQNVVFETGYFIGKLGRKRIVIIADKDVEIPSDLQGVVYSDSKYWNCELLKELREIGYSIDLNKL